ncbi:MULTISPECIES: hypothetical protein [unclassified Duganella]|uniref:hypothetical protein n=1 Tax=unclassified Duganella TaxID=2636909 RepID=UPI0006F6758F|nr:MULTISPECIES: hypothetical protein [unclassified Duganella]KQV53918.1 hypothetical protein ASD07_05055 [Duganella sp. Root336D2]KRB83528.1 hypothetical protein ASE26_10125 [Duganella sp. Root198D2]
MNKRHFLLALAAAIALPALPALAGEPRPFPPSAKRGKMAFGYAPDIAIDGKPRQLSPAARIFSEENLTLVPSALAEATLIVNYTEDMNGNIDRVWILTQEEARLPAATKR